MIQNALQRNNAAFVCTVVRSFQRSVTSKCVNWKKLALIGMSLKRWSKFSDRDSQSARYNTCSFLLFFPTLDMNLRPSRFQRLIPLRKSSQFRCCRRYSSWINCCIKLFLHWYDTSALSGVRVSNDSKWCKSVLEKEERTNKRFLGRGRERRARKRFMIHRRWKRERENS